jgi:hypothetical protein
LDLLQQRVDDGLEGLGVAVREITSSDAVEYTFEFGVALIVIQWIVPLLLLRKDLIVQIPRFWELYPS